MSKERQRIQYTQPSITDLEVSYALDAVRDGWGENHRDYIDRFESDFKEHVGVPFAIATSSCTGALHMGMSALGIGPGDEVILADTNWVATVAPVVYLGATPVFVDIRPDSWCIDPREVEKVITSRTRAIVAVHLYGNLCEMDELTAISQRFGIPVIEDAAEAIGSIYKGRRAGSLGEFGVYSFHGTKTLTTGGEGGMFVTSNRELYENVLTLSNHGRDHRQTKKFWPEVIGFKYKMSNVQAAIGCAQLERVDSLVARKREILSEYVSQFEELGVEHLAFNIETEGNQIGAWMSTVVLETPSSTSTVADRVLKSLNESGIEARPFFAPLSTTPPFATLATRKQQMTWSNKIHRVAINLPSSPLLTKQDIRFIVSTIGNTLQGKPL